MRDGTVVLVYVRSKNNVADMIFTKPTPEDLHKRQATMLLNEGTAREVSEATPEPRSSPRRSAKDGARPEAVA